MSQTKRRRRTKHRGNAAGVVEARGRTGRKPTASEKQGASVAGSKSGATRTNRYDRPPSWRSAFYRSLFFSVALLLLALLLKLGVATAVVYFLIAIVAYTPLSYYTDAWLYRRRQRAKARAGKARTG
jgi:hypothetical protein